MDTVASEKKKKKKITVRRIWPSFEISFCEVSQYKQG